MSRDPVCGKEVDPIRARGVGIWNGRTYYFCSLDHRAAFALDPGAYRDGAAASGRIVAVGREPAAAPPPAPRMRTPISTPRSATPLAATASPSGAVELGAGPSPAGGRGEAAPALDDEPDAALASDHTRSLGDLEPFEDSPDGAGPGAALATRGRPITAWLLLLAGLTAAITLGAWLLRQ